MRVVVPKVQDSDDRLQEAVLTYLQSKDQGAPLDSQTLLERYADVATELLEFLEDESRLTPLLSPLKTDELSSQALLQQPRSFGRYELLQEIGRGGMGIVYQARQEGVGRRVALKIMRAGALASMAELERFRNETQAIAALDHPNIVPVYDVGEHDGQLYYTMPLLEGGSLAQRQPRLRDNPREAAELLTTIARAVHHAHQRGVLHRDIKPSNILLDSVGRPFIADFGLAKRLDAEQSLTETGAVVGTPAYMSPEQALGRTHEITTASDVYGLGAILYAILAGRPPLQGVTLLQTLARVREREPESLCFHNPGVDRDLSAICLKCLEKDPRRRYVSAEALSEDLDRWLAGVPVQARTVGRMGRAWRWCRRNPGVTALSTAIVVLLVAGLAGLSIGLVTVTRAWKETEEQRSQAVSSSQRLRQQLYAAQMPIAYGHWQRGEIEELNVLLSDYAPRDGQEDLRGFEWRHLNGLAQSQPRRRNRFDTPNAITFHAAFSPDGQWVATAGSDRAVRLWDAASGELLAVQEGLGGDANCVAFLPSGQSLISACEDGTLRQWDLQTFKWELLPFQCQGEILCLHLSADGKRLVTAGREPFVRVRNVDDWSIQIELQRTAPTSIALFSPDGSRLLTVGNDAVRGLLEVWTLADDARLEFAIPGATVMHAAAFSPDGTLLATGDESGTVALWDAATGRHLEDLGKHLGHCRFVRFSLDGKLLASMGHDSRVRIWSLEDDALRCHYRADTGRIWSGDFSPDGQRLLTATDNGAVLWDLAAGASSQRFIAVASGGVNRVVFAPRGHQLAVLTSQGQIAIGDIDGNRPFELLPVAALTGKEIPGDLAFLPQSDSFVFAGTDHAVKLWQSKEREELLIPLEPEPSTLPGQEGIPFGLHGCTLTPDGRHLIAGYTRGWLKIWRLPGREAVFADRLAWPYARLLSASPDSRTLAVQMSPGSFRLLDLETCEWISAERSCSSAITSMAFAPDSKSLALGLNDGLLQIVATATAETRLRLSGHLGRVSALAFAPDGQTLATSSVDHTIRLWQVQTGQQLLTLARPEGTVRSLAFSTDGQVLAAGGDPDSHGHNVWLWLYRD